LHSFESSRKHEKELKEEKLKKDGLFRPYWEEARAARLEVLLCSFAHSEMLQEALLSIIRWALCSNAFGILDSLAPKG
jgi:hypothetical protein